MYEMNGKFMPWVKMWDSDYKVNELNKGYVCAGYGHELCEHWNRDMKFACMI